MVLTYLHINVLTHTNRKQLPRKFVIGGQTIHEDPNTSTIQFTINTPFKYASTRFRDWNFISDGLGVNLEIINYVLAKEYNFQINVTEGNKKYLITTTELGDFKKSHECIYIVKGVVLNIIPIHIMKEII